MNKIAAAIVFLIIGIVVGFWWDTCPGDDMGCEYGTHTTCQDRPKTYEEKVVEIEVKCEESLKKDFPDKLNADCYYIMPSSWYGPGERPDCRCETWDTKGGWDKENTRSLGEKINEETHYFNLK